MVLEFCTRNLLKTRENVFKLVAQFIKVDMLLTTCFQDGQKKV